MNTVQHRLIATFVFFCTASALLQAEYLAELSQEEALSKIQSHQISVIDVRSADEFQQGHIPGAINIPHNEIEDRANEIKQLKEKPVLLYCRSGRRSALAEASLTGLGFSQLYHLQGDIQQWTKNQLPLEK
jgi:phage shock protein E